MRIVIAGAGKVGRSIAAELVENKHDVLLIDRDTDLAPGGGVPGATLITADACELTTLERAELNTAQVVIAATGDDKVNLVLSLLAKTEYGVPRVVARVNHPKNEWMFDESWGVDVAVSTPRLMSAVVEEAVSIGDIVRLFTFRQGSANLVELTLASDCECAGRRVGDMAWPIDTALVAIIRGQHVITPHADDALQAGDELLFVAPAEREDELAAMLGG